MFTLDDIVPFRELKRRYLAWVLEQTGQNKSEAARRMNIDRASLHRMLRSIRPRGSERPAPRAPRIPEGGPRGTGGCMPEGGTP